MKFFTLSMIVLSAFLLFSFTSLGFGQGAQTGFNNLMFDDVSKDNPYFDSIYFSYNTGFIEGYEVKDSKQREFKPEKNINRAEFLKLVLEGTGKANKQSYEKCFPDVPSDIWFSTYVCQAKESGIIKGYPDGNFKPDQTINEVEAVKILAEAMDWSVKEGTGEDWYKPYMNIASERKISPKADDFGALMTRGDIAELVFRNKQVDDLKINSYDSKLNNDLFSKYNIPASGPMGPGGIFGPGGPFGNAGAFAPSSSFVAKDESSFSLLGDDFFENRYCYYSDQGEFGDMVLDALNFMSDNNVDELELAGYETSDFGVMFCYNGIAATDLELYTKEIRELNNVYCWADPILSMSAQGTFDTILCYAEPHKTTNIEDYISDNLDDNADKVESIIDIKGPSVLNAGNVEKADFDVSLIDTNGKGVDKEDIEVVATTGIDYHEVLSLNKVGTGLYKASFGSLGAGNYKITAKNLTSGASKSLNLAVIPQLFDHVEIIDIQYPYQTGEANKASVLVTMKDAYENVIPYSSLNTLNAASSLGSTKISHDDYGVFTVDITADDWGIADLAIKKDNNVVDTSVQIPFWPVQIGMPKGIDVGVGQIAVPIYVFYPESKGNFGSFDVILNTELEGMTYLDIEDPIPNDNFATPVVTIGDGAIRVSQTAKEDVASDELVPVGTMLFQVNSLGTGTISVDEAVLQNTAGEEQGYLEKFTGLIDDAGNAIGDAIGGVMDSYWKWYYKIKDQKDVCLDIYIFPGSDVAVDDVNSDVLNANIIFSKIAASCNCNFILNFVIDNIVNLSAADWTAVDLNHDNDLDENELNNLVNSHPAGNKCLPIYYVPQIDGGDLGWSWEGSSEGVSIDNHGAPDRRTLAHELAHQISQSEVRDPNHPPTSTTQGADTAGNLMNYNNTGDALTINQCSLIEKYLP